MIRFYFFHFLLLVELNNEIIKIRIFDFFPLSIYFGVFMPNKLHSEIKYKILCICELHFIYQNEGAFKIQAADVCICASLHQLNAVIFLFYFMFSCLLYSVYIVRLHEAFIKSLKHALFVLFPLISLFVLWWEKKKRERERVQN